MEDDQEQSRAEELKRYSHAGMLEKAHLENDLFDAEKALQERPDDEQAMLQAEIARKKMELFSAEHDNAGAFKFKKFGRRIQELFEPGPDGKTAIEAGEDGELKLAESQAERRFMLVNMGELDRFNKEGGGHAAGDAALGETAATVEKAVTEALAGEHGELTSDYQIFRYDGNTFMVDIASMPLKEFGALVKKMQEAQPKVEGVKDPAPLTVRGMDFKNVVDLVNHIQAELPKGAKIEPGEDAAREIVEVMRRAGDWDMEVNKLFSRAQRVRGKIEAGDEDAEVFFENYAKKSFQGTELGTIEGFRKALEEGTYLGLAEDVAVSASEKRFADGRKVDDQMREMIDERVRARNTTKPLSKSEMLATFTQSGVMTDGERALGDKRQAMEAMEGLAAAASGQEAQMLALRAQAARLEHQIETSRRDKGTGLLERGVHYEHLEKAIGEGKDVATVFVDMGFLKYFDQMGGSDVGDVALKSAAVMMEQAVKESGVKGDVYRYGGDEFTIQVEGGDAAANAVIAALERIRETSEPIAAGSKSRSEYAPTQLAFNYGLADRKMLDDLHGLAVREGKYAPDELEDPARVLNAKAELMTKAADVGIEYNKGYSRFKLLIDRLREPEYASDPERKKQVDALVTFSNKALFAELGGVDKLRALAESGLEGEELDEQILDFVVDKVGETRAREKGQKELLDLLLASQVKVAFLTERLQDMQGVVDMQEHKIEKLQTSLRKAEDEKRQILEARGSIDRAA